MATKRRSMPVTFDALIEWQRGVFAAMSAKHIPEVPGMLLAIAVMRNGGTVSQLAEILATDIKTASRVLQNVRARGWATLERDTKDERQRRVMLTDAGMDIAKTIHGSLVDMAFRIVENVAGPQSGATFGERRVAGTHHRQRRRNRYSVNRD
jgi:hypothetical protein